MRAWGSTSGAIGGFFRFAFRMDMRDGSSGSGMYSSWSRRPGRMIAGSMMSGRLVAPMMQTFFFRRMQKSLGNDDGERRLAC